MGSGSNQQFAGGCAKAAEEAPEEAREDAARAAYEPQLLHGAGIYKWFSVRMGFCFLSMTALRRGRAQTPSGRLCAPDGAFRTGSERWPKGKNMQKRRSEVRCCNCGGLDHHAKECKLPPQPKKCHFCQSISHMVASCPCPAPGGTELSHNGWGLFFAIRKF
ncbi:hypothetical protein H8959_005005 [Pygathrix nigripes]